jgi:enoyl-[acyl-carrier protein] reductase III
MQVYPMTELRLDGKIAIVTGASRGLGRAIAEKLCACGCHVYLNYVSSELEAKRAAEELSALRGTAVAIKGDMSDPEDVHEVLGVVREQHGRLDILVHNAATFTPMTAMATNPTTFLAEQALALNVLLHGATPIAELMAGGGRVVLISSNGAARVIPGYVAVGVAKAALESLAKYLAVELAPKDIAVNVVASAMLDKGETTVNRELIGMLAARTPAGRLTTPADVADAVALFCTEEAHWIHGQVLMVDGGLGLRA